MDLYQEALDRLEDFVRRAREAGVSEPDAATLATADRAGRPRARVVLVRERDRRGLTFYTNLQSEKGLHLLENPFVALAFWREALAEQVLVEGRAERVSETEADAYWARRPREHQLGAWASDQSRPLDDRRTLEDRYREFERRWAGRAVPRPPHWSGLRVVPDAFEFWRFQPSRLHDRERYAKEDGTWTRTLLYP